MTGYGDSYCGLYCGACSILCYGETGRGDAFVGCLAGIPAQALACAGCKSDAPYVGCRTCKIRDCARAKGVAHCADCADHPCRAYAAWASAAAVLPHVREARANGDAIRRDGVDAWLDAQQRRWSCPGCGERFSWYAAQCARCGRALVAETHALSRVRKLIAGWILPKAYRKASSILGVR